MGRVEWIVRPRAIALGLGIMGCGADSPVPDGGVPGFSLPEVIHVEPGTLFRGAFSTDGAEFYYFVKVSEEGEDYRVFGTEWSAGEWSQPRLIPLGDPDASSMYPTVSPDGELLVFTSYRPVDGDSASANLWMARRGAVGWAEPTPLTDASVPENYDSGPWFGPTGDLRFHSTAPDWSESWMRVSPRIGDSFGAWSEDMFWDELEWPRQTYHMYSGTLNRAGTMAVIELARRQPDGGLGKTDLWVARRGPGGWSQAEPLGVEVNTGGTENFPTFAPDDSTLVFVRDFTQFHAFAVGGL